MMLLFTRVSKLQYANGVSPGLKMIFVVCDDSRDSIGVQPVNFFL